VWDDRAVEQHPEWASINAEGKQDPNFTSTFGPYVDELLIPQVREVLTAYDLDGVWMDGECWAVQMDYSPAALEQWRKETGYADAPKNRSDPYWFEWKMFHRLQFEKYLAHWVDALHESHPNAYFTSNWAYATCMPKTIEAKIDWLSGDHAPTSSVDYERVEGRYLANTGMPWELHAWGFNHAPNTPVGNSHKFAVHLQQEAAATLMLGGGFTVGTRCTRSGYVPESIIDVLAEVAEFCRARQEVSHRNTSVPQVALLLSSETFWDQCGSVYRGWRPFDELDGVLHALLELHYSVDILAEHQLQPQLHEFPLVVIPDSYKLADDFRQSLLNYVQQGGKLLLLGEKCARLFEPALGINLKGEPQGVEAVLQSSAGQAHVIGPWQEVEPTTAKAIALRYPTRDTRKEGVVAATLVSYGKGQIGAVYGPVALGYLRAHHPALRQFIGEIAQQLFPNPAVSVEAPPCVDIALRRTPSGKLSLHLLNLAGAQRGNYFLNTDFIPGVGLIKIRMRAPQEPQNVNWIPNLSPVEWTWENGTLTVTIPSLHIHGVLVVE